jgi:hypothetical protein
MMANWLSLPSLKNTSFCRKPDLSAHRSKCSLQVPCKYRDCLIVAAWVGVALASCRFSRGRLLARRAKTPAPSASLRASSQPPGRRRYFSNIRHARKPRSEV